METASAMDTGTTSTRGAVYASTVKVTADVTTIDPTPICRVRGYGRDASVAATSRGKARTGMIAMEPRPGANKDPAREPAWPIVAVGCASVGVIIVIAIRTHRRRPHDDRSHSYPDSKSLRMCVRRD
jgi:hypothetical protein